jgi:hypothetical protein
VANQHEQRAGDGGPESKGAAFSRPHAGQNLFGMKFSPGKGQLRVFHTMGYPEKYR